ncbi:hypothetical protein SO802_006853 [Lithocarpus litseifolius]|uniref:Uncharacterized protein n=1 Tax=Lithocarpus litseifolius TaxID=425828 RepID=A0AAW2DM26_9ROSI
MRSIFWIRIPSISPLPSTWLSCSSTLKDVSFKLSFFYYSIKAYPFLLSTPLVNSTFISSLWFPLLPLTCGIGTILLFNIYRHTQKRDWFTIYTWRYVYVFQTKPNNSQENERKPSKFIFFFLTGYGKKESCMTMYGQFCYNIEKQIS